MILSSQIDGVLSALSVTQREGRQWEEKWITRQHTHTHTPNPTAMVYATRLPVSTEALINWGQARAFVSLGQKQRYMVNFYWRWLAASWGSEMMRLSLEPYKSTDKNIWFQYIKLFSIFLSALLLCFSAPCLLLILQKKHKKKLLYVPTLIL